MRQGLGARLQRRLVQQGAHLLLQPACAQGIGLHIGVGQQGLGKSDVVLNPVEPELGQGAACALQGRVKALRVVHDDLGQQGVKAGVRLHAGMAMAVHANARSCGRLIGQHQPAGRHGAAIRPHALGVDAHLNRAACGRGNLRLLGTQFKQGGALRQPQLPLHQVQPRDLLGDGVLHLQARVGFHEVPASAVQVQQELEGAQATQLHGLRHSYGCKQQGLAHLDAELRGRRNLDELLMVALQRAIALPHMTGRTRAIAQHLHFDVAGAAHQLLDIQVGTAKGGQRLGLAALEAWRDLVEAFNHAHAASTTTGQGLDHHGAGQVAMAQRPEEDLRLSQAHGAVHALGDRHLTACSQRARLCPVAQQVQHLGSRAHKGQASSHARPGKGRVLAQQAVARVHMRAGLLAGGQQHLSHVQVGRHATARQGVHHVHMVGMQGVAFVLRHQAHGAPAQLSCGTGNANGDLTTVDDQQDRGLRGAVYVHEKSIQASRGWAPILAAAPSLIRQAARGAAMKACVRNGTQGVLVPGIKLG